MGQKKAKKSENGNQVNAKVLVATERIKVLCAEVQIVPTNKFAVMKDLRPGAGERRFTSWGKNKAGERGLVVLSTDGGSIKFCTNASAKYPNMKTIQC